MQIQKFLLPILLGLSVAPVRAKAENSASKNRPDFFVDTQYAITTTKSKLVASNDMGTALRYGFGTYAGNDLNLSFLLHFDHDVTNFALNSSKIDMNWQDTRIRYHLGIFYFGVLFSRLEMKASQQSGAVIDAAGSGIGGNTGLQFAIGHIGSAYLDIQTASLSTMKNALDQTLSIKQRMDLDVGASIDLTAKLLDLTFGYKIRQLTIQTDSAYKEALYATYFGLRFAFFF